MGSDRRGQGRLVDSIGGSACSPGCSVCAAAPPTHPLGAAGARGQRTRAPDSFQASSSLIDALEAADVTLGR
jgi:hypothetical protein